LVLGFVCRQQIALPHADATPQLYSSLGLIIVISASLAIEVPLPGDSALLLEQEEIVTQPVPLMDQIKGQSDSPNVRSREAFLLLWQCARKLKYNS
jgi:hypothetical protein